MKVRYWQICGLGALVLACGTADDSGLFDSAETADLAVSAEPGGGSSDSDSGQGAASAADAAPGSGEAPMVATGLDEAGSGAEASEEGDASEESGLPGVQPVGVQGNAGDEAAGESEAGDDGAGESDDNGAEAAPGDDEGTSEDGAEGDDADSGAEAPSAPAGVEPAPGDPAAPRSIPIDGSIAVRQSCELAACGGGELAGKSYRYVGACVEQDALLGNLAAQCAGLEIVELGGQVRGTVSFTDDSVTQDVTLEFAIVLTLPADCLQGSCELTAADLASGGTPGASCEDADGGACTCSLPLTSSAQASTSFAASGDQVTLGESTVNYCASEAGLELANGLGDIDYVLRAIEPAAG